MKLLRDLSMYTHFHKYGLQPMRKTMHLFWPEWCSSTLHDVKILPFPLDFKQRKEKGILGATLAKTSALFCALAVDNIYGSECTKFWKTKF